LIGVVGLAEAADSAHTRHALLAGVEAAIIRHIAHTEHRAPRIILRLRACAYPGGYGENCQHENNDLHGDSPDDSLGDAHRDCHDDCHGVCV
jgi:hypothetical protein